ncbi:glycosyltransferase family A protein [Mangrovicella endophytica]|uniref:glycosyltransferase family A protein n=1 Tax=Mangrovicella endophytica TaxID=2066697 RepID=UPI000C9DC2F3|nr:glycosyltransferase family A protein [Mangrovicella endophytica]
MTQDRTPFTFGIPLIAREATRNWPLVEALLGLTLRSVAAQTDADYRVVIAGHDAPSCVDDDPRITFLPADWKAEPVRADNLDAGRKKHAINAHVAAEGGGFLMFLDADDWIDTRLVATCRAGITAEHVGGIVTTGFAVDAQGLKAAPIPHPAIFDQDFHRICGSTTIARIEPGSDDPLRRDPHAILHEHYRWIEVAAEHGGQVARLDLLGAYLVNTSQNHSETHGPFADWRRSFTAAVSHEGEPVDDAFAARFGLTRDAIAAVVETVGRG